MTEQEWLESENPYLAMPTGVLIEPGRYKTHQRKLGLCLCGFSAQISAQGVNDPWVHSHYTRIEQADGSVVFLQSEAQFWIDHFARRDGHWLCQIVKDVFGNPFQHILGQDNDWWEDSAVRMLAAAIYEQHTFEDMPILGDAIEEAGCTEDYVLDHCRSASMKKYTCGNVGTHKHGRNPGEEIHGIVHTGNPRAPHHHHDEKCAFVMENRHVRGCWLVDLILGKS